MDEAQGLREGRWAGGVVRLEQPGGTGGRLAGKTEGARGSHPRNINCISSDHYCSKWFSPPSSPVSKF